MRRFVVRQVDECGSIAERDHSWDVVDRVTGNCVFNADTRASARAWARKRNEEEKQNEDAR